MFNSWHQIEDWVRNNGVVKWTITRSPMRKSDDDKSQNYCDKLVDSSLYKERTFEEKLDLTKRTLEAFGERCYIYGYTSDASTRPNLYMDICLSTSTPQAAVGIVPQPMATNGVDEAALTERIRKEIKMEYDQREYERERKDFERERKEFEEAKNGTLGMIIGYLAPYIPVLKDTLGRRVAGLDAEKDVHTAPVRPIHERVSNDEPETAEPEQPQEPTVWDEFTEDEAERIMQLMSRFKKVEPENYLRLIESVVTMAENGDSTYTMAKGFLMK